MNIRYYIKLATSNIFSKKKYFYRNTITLTLCFTFLIIVLSLNKSLNTFTNEYILNSLGSKTVQVYYQKTIAPKNDSTEESPDSSNKTYNSDEIIKLIKQYTSVVDVQKNIGDSYGYIENSKELFGSNNNQNLALKSTFDSQIPQKVDGESFKNNETGVCMIPSQFYPNNIKGDQIKKGDTTFLNGKDFIGKNITIVQIIKNDKGEKVDEIKSTFKVVGTYDCVATLNEANVAYISYTDLEKINKEYMEKYKKYNNINDNDDYETINVLIDAPKNVKTFTAEFSEKYKVSANPITSGTGTIGIISKVVLFVGLGISIAAFIFTILYVSLNTINSLRKRRAEIGVLKAIGYSNKNIKTLILFEGIISNAISLGISLVISFVVINIADIIILKNLSMYMQSFKMTISISTICISLITMLVVTFVSSLKSVNYATKITPAQAVKYKG